MKSIIVIILVICAGIGFYAWQQQKKAQNELKQLQDSGVDITFSLQSRPLLAVDSGRGILHLLFGNGVHNAKAIPLVQIKSIRFIEAPIFNQKENSDTQRPDSLIITTTTGKTYRVGDLYLSATKARELFEQHQILTDKLSTQQRRD